jgi:hypothetical protein
VTAVVIVCGLSVSMQGATARAQPRADVASRGQSEHAIPFTREDRQRAELVVLLWNAYSDTHSPILLFRAAFAYCQFCPRRLEKLEETFAAFPARIKLMHVFATCLHEPPPPSPFIKSVLGLPP